MPETPPEFAELLRRVNEVRADANGILEVAEQIIKANNNLSAQKAELADELAKLKDDYVQLDAAHSALKTEHERVVNELLALQEPAAPAGDLTNAEEQGS